MARISKDGIVDLLTNPKTGRVPMALLQGYPFTGFAKISNGAILLAPAHRRLVPHGIRWDLFWDIRVFGELGETHVWKLADDIWMDRFEMARNGADILPRDYPVWGTPTGDAEEDWMLFREERGTEVWIPREFATHSRVVLQIDQILGETGETGIVSIVDAMIRCLKPSSKEEDL